MKKAFIFIGVVAASVVASSLTVSILHKRTGNVEYVETIVERTPQLGSHFTSFQEGSYPDLTYAAENSVKAVVNIEVTQEVQTQSRGYDPFYEFFGIPQQQGQGQKRLRKGGGSGVIISEDGYIVTNNHVIDNASTVKVKLNDGREFDATVIGSDPTTDIALVKVEAEGLPTLKFGSSDALRLGEWVLAIGSPFGLQSTITAGIVSAKARNLGAIPAEFGIESFIQTDAAVNPGNSGGALVNTHGELIGINTLIKSQTGSYTGYSFAVPEAIVRKVVLDLKEYGVVQRALLGISFIAITQEVIDQMGDQMGVDQIGGVYVASVSEGGSASEAGIRKGDVILSIDGIDIKNEATLQEQIARHRPNDKVKLSVKRGDSVKQIDVVLRNKAGKTELIAKTDQQVSLLGANFVNASDKLSRQLEISGGVQVSDIESDSILADAGVKDGFIITHINNRRVESVADLGSIKGEITSVDGIYPNGRSASYPIIR